MLNKRNLLVMLGLSGAAVVAVLNLCANRSQRTDARLHRKALQRWEGEGGNQLQPAVPGAQPAEPVPDAAS